MLGAIRAAFRFVRRNTAAATALYLADVALFVLVLASYAVFTAAAAWLESRISAGASRGR